eukprot:m.386475 g.386475  ORF g.386475 m.386475 type:complete len:70 (-) comp20054_c0_seq3:721-930(-)
MVRPERSHSLCIVFETKTPKGKTVFRTFVPDVDGLREELVKLSHCSNMTYNFHLSGDQAVVLASRGGVC